MIGYLKGQVLSSQGHALIVGVGSAQVGLVGYQVSTPSRAGYVGRFPGESAEFFIYTHVREDALELFGFATPGEKELFLVLTSVSGIGPRTALGILSHAEPSQLLEMIQSGDAVGLTRLPGIGKKTAERLILETKDSVEKRVQAGDFGDLFKGRATGTRAAGATARAAGGLAERDSAARDAREALIELGFREADAARVISELLMSEESPKTAEALIRAALRQQVV